MINKEIELLFQDFSYEKLYSLLEKYDDIDYNELAVICCENKKYNEDYMNNMRITNKTCNLLYHIVVEKYTQKNTWMKTYRIRQLFDYFNKNIIISHKYILKLINKNIIDLSSDWLPVTNILLDVLIANNIVAPIIFHATYTYDYNYDKIKLYIDLFDESVSIRTLELYLEYFRKAEISEICKQMIKTYMYILKHVHKLSIESSYDIILQSLLQINEKCDTNINKIDYIIKIINIFPELIKDVIEYMSDYMNILVSLNYNIFSKDQIKLIVETLCNHAGVYAYNTGSIITYLYKNEILQLEALILLLSCLYLISHDIIHNLVDVVFDKYDMEFIFDRINKMQKITNLYLYCYILLKYKPDIDITHFRFILNIYYQREISIEIDILGYHIVKRFYYMFETNDHKIKNIDEIKNKIRNEMETKSARK